MSVCYKGSVVLEWWEEHYGQYGCMGTGWWTEEGPSSGPPSGLVQLLDALNINLPPVEVPRLPVQDEEDPGPSE